MITGVITALLTILFICMTVWAYSRNRQTDFSVAAQLPLHEELRQGDMP